MVVLFHFTTKFDELYGHASAPAFSLPWGHYGVNLFFMISGFVIFMTLERIKTPADFLVSRFSRLYPAYWFSVALTFSLVSWMGLPGKTVRGTDALLNVLMFHGLFNIPNVDGVYWTLQVELLFYAWSLLAFRLGLLAHVHRVLLAALSLHLAYYVAATGFQVEFSWTLSQLLILPYISWFTCGIMVYRLSSGRTMWRRELAMVMIAIVTLMVTESFGLGALAVVCTAALFLAARNRLVVFNATVLTWLGQISYTLYLVHENIGWALLLRLKQHGVNTNLSIALALASALVVAWMITLYVEKPAMTWIRKLYRQRRAGGVEG